MCNRKGHRRCSSQCPPKPNRDGGVSLGSTCLICWNTGCRIPLGDKQPTIDKWVELHPGTLVPAKPTQPRPAKGEGE